VYSGAVFNVENVFYHLLNRLGLFKFLLSFCIWAVPVCLE